MQDRQSHVQDLQSQMHQFAHEDRAGMRQSHDVRSKTSVYAQKPPAVRPQPQLLPQQLAYDQHQQPQVYGVQSQVQYLQTHILPTGQTVYVNVPAPQYGHPPVQYQQILQQIPAGLGPNGEQFISVLPMQQGAPGPAGNFAYFAPDGQSAVGPTYIINPQLQRQIQQPQDNARRTGSPNRGPGTMESQRQPQSGGRTNRDKGGRGKRGNNRREPKSPASQASPILETFKAKKNRNWTLLDIKGEASISNYGGHDRLILTPFL